MAGKIEGEVLNKYKVEDSKREAFKGRGAPLEWRRVRRCKKYRIKSGEKISGQELRFVQRVQLAAAAKQAGGVSGRRRDEAAAKNMKDLTKKIKPKGRMEDAADGFGFGVPNSNPPNFF